MRAGDADRRAASPLPLPRLPRAHHHCRRDHPGHPHLDQRDQLVTPEHDTGLAVERTRLSWRRTSMTATGVLVIGVFRLLLPRPSGWSGWGVGLVALFWR